MDFRVGIGYDVHRLVSDRKLVLGGVEIDFEMGLLGHSDADVLTHAIMDSLLGAAGERDIGYRFPDSNPEYAGSSSLRLLKNVVDYLEALGWRINNVDATVIAERPKLSEHIYEMRERLAETMGVDESRVGVKATTEEGLGFTGALEGIAAQAVCSLVREEDK